MPPSINTSIQPGMNQALKNYFTAHPYARRLTTNFLITCAINVGIALLITYMMHSGFSLYVSLVYAFCIGIPTWILIDGGWIILWGRDRPPVSRFFLLCAVSIPVARILGEKIAVQLLGMPQKNILPIWEQNSLRFVVMSLLISAVVLWFFWNRSRVACLIADAETEKARVAAIEKQAMQAQLQLLQAQIEPHMLFNTLANLQGLIAVDAPRAQHMLDQLILYLRATLVSSRAEQTTLAHEFSLMDAYLELMSIRMGARLTYTLELPDNLRNTAIAPMLLQPLIENAIKHGLEPKIDGGKITVTAKQEGDILMLSVADTGLGLQGSTPTNGNNGTNVGLANVRERLRALYGERATFSLTANTPTGVLAQINIPLP